MRPVCPSYASFSSGFRCGYKWSYWADPILFGEVQPACGDMECQAYLAAQSMGGRVQDTAPCHLMLTPSPQLHIVSTFHLPHDNLHATTGQVQNMAHTHCHLIVYPPHIVGGIRNLSVGKRRMTPWMQETIFQSSHLFLQPWWAFCDKRGEVPIITPCFKQVHPINFMMS